VESKLGPLGTSAIHWPIVPAPGDCEDGEFGGLNGRRNRSTRRKPALTQLCPPQIPLDQTRDWTRAAAVGSQLLTASAMARPLHTAYTSGYRSKLRCYRNIAKFRRNLLPLSSGKNCRDFTLHWVVERHQHFINTSRPYIQCWRVGYNLLICDAM
jgi:hypothetical protein